MKNLTMREALVSLGISRTNLGTSTGEKWLKSTGNKIDSYSPADGKFIGSVYATDQKGFDAVMKQANAAFKVWRQWPAPKRGEVVRQIGDQLRRQKEALGHWVS